MCWSAEADLVAGVGVAAVGEIRGHTVGYRKFAQGSTLQSGGEGQSAPRRLGILAGAGALICWVLWRLEFVSTWCAFAALCSVVLLGWVNARRAR